MIAASDYPHGIFEFTRELSYVDESFYENHSPPVHDVFINNSTNVTANYAYVTITRKNGRQKKVCIVKIIKSINVYLSKKKLMYHYKTKISLR